MACGSENANGYHACRDDLSGDLGCLGEQCIGGENESELVIVKEHVRIGVVVKGGSGCPLLDPFQKERVFGVGTGHSWVSVCA